jgi:hypothetical protein
MFFATRNGFDGVGSRLKISSFTEPLHLLARTLTETWLTETCLGGCATIRGQRVWQVASLGVRVTTYGYHGSEG